MTFVSLREKKIGLLAMSLLRFPQDINEIIQNLKKWAEIGGLTIWFLLDRVTSKSAYWKIVLSTNILKILFEVIWYTRTAYCQKRGGCSRLDPHWTISNLLWPGKHRWHNATIHRNTFKKIEKVECKKCYANIKDYKPFLSGHTGVATECQPG